MTKYMKNVSRRTQPRPQKHHKKNMTKKITKTPIEEHDHGHGKDQHIKKW
jgi:hypothetical protein